MYISRLIGSQTQTPAGHHAEERHTIGHGLFVHGRAVWAADGALGRVSGLRRTRRATDTGPAQHHIPVVRQRLDGQDAIRAHRKGRRPGQSLRVPRRRH